MGHSHVLDTCSDKPLFVYQTFTPSGCLHSAHLRLPRPAAQPWGRRRWTDHAYTHSCSRLTLASDLVRTIHNNNFSFHYNISPLKPTDDGQLFEVDIAAYRQACLLFLRRQKGLLLIHLPNPCSPFCDRLTRQALQPYDIS